MCPAARTRIPGKARVGKGNPLNRRKSPGRSLSILSGGHEYFVDPKARRPQDSPKDAMHLELRGVRGRKLRETRKLRTKARIEQNAYRDRKSYKRASSRPFPRKIWGND